MFRQLQMIQWMEMPKIMALCHGTMGPRQCVSLPEALHDIVKETRYSYNKRVKTRRLNNSFTS